MVKLSNRRIVNDLEGLKPLMQKQLPVKVSFTIARNLVKIEEVLKVYNAEKEKIINKFAEKQEDGKVKIENDSFVILPENVEQWNTEYNELLDIENEIETYTFSIDDLKDDMSTAEIMLIDYMIEE